MRVATGLSMGGILTDGLHPLLNAKPSREVSAREGSRFLFQLKFTDSAFRLVSLLFFRSAGALGSARNAGYHVEPEWSTQPAQQTR